jgi:outer membrane protein
MKKTILSVLLTGLISTSSMADTLAGVYIGGSVWSNEASGVIGESSNQIDFGLADEDQGSYFIAIEHPIPFIPNLKVAAASLETTGAANVSDFEFGGQPFNGDVATNFDVNFVDYTLYYELFDNDILSFDFGLTGRDFDGDVAVSSTNSDASIEVTEIVPMLYVAANVGLPLTGFNVFAEGNFLSFDDHTLYDYQAGISYEVLDNIAVDFNIMVGYRVMKLELEDLDDLYTDVEFEGVFAGAVIHF